MPFKRLIALCATALLILLPTGCRGRSLPSTSGELTVLTIGTADSGGTMYPVGSAIARELNQDDLKINVSASNGSSMNIQNLAAGEIDLGLVSGDAAYTAYHDPDGTGTGLRAIAAVYTSVSNWLSPVSTGAVYVHDLKGLQVGVGPERSTTELAAQAAIQAVGLNSSNTTLVNCGLGAGSESVLNGELDAIHGFSGNPISGLASLAEQVRCRVLRYTQDELDTIIAGNDYYIQAVIPAGTYAGQKQDVDTFGIKCLLCVDISMDEDLVYRLTKALWESRTALAAAHPCMADMEEDSFLYQDLTVPLHPGAERFYREAAAGFSD